MFLKLLLISLLLISIAIIAMSVRILIKPKGQFPETHVGHNKEMRKLGIKCAQKNDIGCSGPKKKEECSSCDLLI